MLGSRVTRLQNTSNVLVGEATLGDESEKRETRRRLCTTKTKCKTSEEDGDPQEFEVRQLVRRCCIVDQYPGEQTRDVEAANN